MTENGQIWVNKMKTLNEAYKEIITESPDNELIIICNKDNYKGVSQIRKVLDSMQIYYDKTVTDSEVMFSAIVDSSNEADLRNVKWVNGVTIK